MSDYEDQACVMHPDEWAKIRRDTAGLSHADTHLFHKKVHTDERCIGSEIIDFNPNNEQAQDAVDRAHTPGMRRP